MKLRDFSRRIHAEEQPNFDYTLQGGQDLTELTEEKLEDYPETIYIANSQSVVFGKVEKETLIYLLRRQQDFKFEQVLDSMNDGVIAVDAAGRIFYANPAYFSLLGVPLRRILGRFIQDVEPGSLLNQTLLKRTAVSSEKQLIPSIKKYVSLRAFPLWDGEIFQGAVSIFRDVTKLHRLDQKVRHMSGIVDEYSQRIRSQEAAENLGISSYNRNFQNTVQKAATVALTDVPLLISGESGTGKTVMARYLHQCSSRREKPFIMVNCAAVPENMIEEELFGSAGVIQNGAKQGKCALADGGTLFLDEIGELPLSVQYRLLYLLQQDGMDPMGDNGEPAPDVRLIASASQPLDAMVREKKFRKELFFRLNTITVSIPPLRERPDDIIPMANRFLSECNEKYHRNVIFSSQTYQDLQRYSWPGNLRELKSYVERAVILADSSLPVIERSEKRTPADEEPHVTRRRLSDEPLESQVRAFEADVLRETLRACGGNRTAAMEKLGVSRRTFYRKCAELGVPLSDKK